MASRKATGGKAGRKLAVYQTGAGRIAGFNATDRDEASDYDGVHVFVFVDHVVRDEDEWGLSSALDDLREVDEVRFAARMLGPYPLFAHLRTDDVPGMLDLIDGPLWRRGVRCTYAKETSVTSTASGTKGTKRDTPGVIALTRIWMEPSTSQEDDVETLLQKLPDLVGPTFKGGSSVAGDFDILLQLGHDDDVDVVLHAASRVRRFEGAARSETSLTQLPN
jgi:hypothetical protein